MKTIMQFFAGIGILGVAAVGCVVVCVCGACIWGIVTVVAKQNEATQNTIALNNGRGAQNRPIPAGTWAKFDNGQVRILQVEWDATQQVLDDTLLGETSLAAGSKYILMRFEIFCEKQQCDQSELDIRLVADDDSRWDEELSLVKYNEDMPDAVQGAKADGWQAFEFPIEERFVQTVQIKWEGVTLYLTPPAN
jgi:hypothetical protein